jgi:hypothetical protein
VTPENYRIAAFVTSFAMVSGQLLITIAALEFLDAFVGLLLLWGWAMVALWVGWSIIEADRYEGSWVGQAQVDAYIAEALR